MKLYGELADWWPLVSAPEDYADEASLYVRVIEHAVDGPVRDVLELGSGGGNNASHMKHRFTMTLVDPAPGMLEHSRRSNPECEHIQGDMRTVRLGRIFDAVFVHDAVMYMVGEDDLRAAIETTFVHVRPGGAAIFVPDCTAETYQPHTAHGGHDGGARSLRYVEWSHPPVGTTYTVSFGFLLREGDGPVRTVHDDHVFGLFGRATWLKLLTDAGFEAEGLLHDYGDPEHHINRELFIGRRPR